jgi:carbamoyltransferase
MTHVLGISALYHDSAAALLTDGQIRSAAQEERFTRKKHDARFPAHAVRYCLQEAGLRPGDLDYVVFYDKPLLKFERLMETYLAFAPAGIRSFCTAMPTWLMEKRSIRSVIRKNLGPSLRAPLVFLEHHESHAASAFFPSPYEEAAILTLDGVGEWSTATYGTGSGNSICLTHQIAFPHSLGLLYSAFTYYCGFKVNSGEYKLMGLAPYGRPVYVDSIYKYLVDVKPDGSLWLNMDYFNYCHGLTMTNRRFDALFGGPPRNPESELDQRHMDLASSIQAVTEDVVLRMAQHLHRTTRQRNLVMAGGVALNCVANGKLCREGPFDSIWIQPAAGDAGGALGAAAFVWYQLLGKPRQPDAHDSQQGSFLGPSFSTRQIQEWLSEKEVPFQRFDFPALNRRVAELLNEGKVVGWFQGRMEFGPRALGARSILGDPRNPKMQALMNLKIKYRESFRPFAPCVLQEHAADWFDMGPAAESPYMLLVAPVRETKAVPITSEERRTMYEDPDLRKRVNVVRSSVPAVTHVDYSARVQTVDAERNPRMHGLLNAFNELTGCPVLVNTSFNVRGEPIVCTPEDAYRCFLATEMDILVCENCLIDKRGFQPPSRTVQADYLAQFQLD